jgi:hypothetical protein
VHGRVDVGGRGIVQKNKVFGLPAYYAEYEFESGKLVRLRFGFESP